MDSHAPVEEFKLFFRRLPKDVNLPLGHNSKEDATATNSVNERPRGDMTEYFRGQQGVNRSGKFGENSTHQMAGYEPYWYQNGQGGIVHWTGNDWRDVILPAIPLSHLYTQQMSYLIHGLEPDRKYEAKVLSR